MFSIKPTSTSHTRSYSNSTCPLPSLERCSRESDTPLYKLSRDLTNLYEVFSGTTNSIVYKNENMVCFCCEQKIVKHRENSAMVSDEERKRKVEELLKSNKITTSLIYGSNQVRRYMKKVMTRDNWSTIMKQGFPCPHMTLWNGDESNSRERSSIHHGTFHCTLCDRDQMQQTLRLTLTPLSCRALDNEIYGEYQNLQRLDKERKRRGMLHLG